jgi:tetratricopeptide (TPR) repeat protein
MASTVLPDIEGFDSSQLQQILNDLDSQTQKAGKAKLPPISFSSEDERLKLEQGLHKAKRALIDVKRLEATSHLVHGDFDAAAVEAGRALKLSLDVFGPGKIELVSCHLLLAEANLGLGRQKFTAEYLARANWCILKNPDCSNRLKSQLYRNFGKLYASQGKYDEALRQLANDIYFSSLQSGPEHVDTAGGYYYMATVFYLQSKIDSALGMCDKVVEIWMKEGKRASPTALSESQVMEGVQVISKIVVLREEALGIDHVATGEACFVLGLLYNHSKEPAKARGLIGKACKIYQQELGANHPTTIDCISRLQLLGGNAGSVAPSQSAVTGSNPDPRAFAAAGQKDSPPSVSVQQSNHAVVSAPESDIADAEQPDSAAAAVVPSILHPDAALADGAVVGNAEEEMIAASSADANVENTSGSSLGDAPTVADIVAATGADGPNSVDDSAAVATVDDAVVPTESASDEIVAVTDADAPHPADDSAAVGSAVLPTESVSDEIVAVTDADAPHPADDSAAVGSAVLPTESAFDESVTAQSTSEEIARDDDNTPAALAADATSDAPSSESAPAVEEGDVAAAVELPVTEPDGTAERAPASASIEQSDS